ncbi:MAG: hypothetical protein ABMB14_08295 [Myxococcota bacterium]
MTWSWTRCWSWSSRWTRAWSRWRSRWWSGAWALTAVWCGCLPDPHGGTAVGNPGDADIKARSVDPEVVLAEVTVPVGAVVVDRCGGDAVVIEAPTILDGLAPSDAPVAVPAGVWCGLSLALDGPVVLVGDTPATAFSVALDVGTIATADPVVVDGEPLLVEFPVTIDRASLEALGPDVVLDAAPPRTAEWAADAAAGAAWRDIDQDGQVSGPDVRVGAPAPADVGLVGALASEGGGGCDTGSTGSGGGSGAVAAALTVALARLVRTRRAGSGSASGAGPRTGPRPAR